MKWIVALILLLLATEATAFDVRKRWHPSLPNPARLMELPLAEIVFIGLPWCGATALLISAAMKPRELKLSEATSAVASCVIPVLGGLFVRQFAAQLDSYPLPPPYRYDPGRLP